MNYTWASFFPFGKNFWLSLCHPATHSIVIQFSPEDGLLRRKLTFTYEKLAFSFLRHYPEVLWSYCVLAWPTSHVENNHSIQMEAIQHHLPDSGLVTSKLFENNMKTTSRLVSINNCFSEVLRNLCLSHGTMTHLLRRSDFDNEYP